MKISAEKSRIILSDCTQLQAYTYVLAFEVLDNLPHDCVVRRAPGGEWQEVTVERGPSGARQLGERRLQDELICDVLGAAQWSQPGAACFTNRLYRTGTKF